MILFNRWVQLAAALALAGFFCWRWLAGIEERGRIEASLDAAVKANDTNQDTITELERRIRVMVEERTMDAQEREAAMAKRDRELAAAVRAADRARRERDALFRSTPGCEELARLDIAGACPGIGSRLQDLSRRHRDEDRGDPGGGG